MLLTSVAIIVSLAWLAGCQKHPAAVENLVLICIDTVRADTFFSQRLQDPLSERLSSAQQYRNASSAAPWTIPSVASTFTGLYPVQHSAGRFQKQPANLDTEIPSALSPSAQTLAELLKEQNFRTAAFSAHPWMGGDFGLQQGFSQVRLYKGWQKLTAHLAEWLDEDVEPRPFFAYLHLMEAHDWHRRSKEDRGQRLAALSPELLMQLRADASSAACTDEGSDVCQRNLIYNLAVREVRTGIDRVLQVLEERRLLQNTLVIVFADHGEEFGEHKTEHQQRNDPREVKGFGHGHSLYQELLHVPLIIWHPGMQGSIRQDLVSLIDVVPSTLGWLGIPQPDESLPGRMLPTGAQATQTDDQARVLYASGLAYGDEQVAAREGNTKSIMYYPDERFEYFDLTKDPEEKHPEQNNALTMRFDVLTGDYLDMKRDLDVAGPELDKQTLEHLKSIGYLQGIDDKNAADSAKPRAQELAEPFPETGVESGEEDNTETPPK